MCVGLTRRNRECASRPVDPTGHLGTEIYDGDATDAAEAVEIKRCVPSSVGDRHRISKTKRRRQKADEAKWEKPVNGSKRGNYPMKWSLVVLMAILSAMPAAGLAQQPQSSSAATASAGPAATQKPSTTDSSDIAHYIIGPEDSLQITVWKEPTLSGTVPVRPDGRISMVLLGDLQAAGMTPMQLAADITQRLKKYVQDPVVSVVVLAVNSQRIFMIGEVGHVGAISMTPGMTPLQAIAAAGGLSPFAHSKRIYILRGTGAAQKKIPFDYKKALKGDNKQDVSLEPGDTIVVP